MLICFSKTKIYYVDLELIKSTQKNYKYKTWQKGYIIFKDISYSVKKITTLNDKYQKKANKVLL